MGNSSRKSGAQIKEVRVQSPTRYQKQIKANLPKKTQQIKNISRCLDFHAQNR